MKSFTRSLPLLIGAAALFLAIPGAERAIGATAPETKDECEVCHNGNNPHTVIIPCNKVPQYLANHPGDTEGPCTGVTHEKPPKPPPTPKP